MINIKKSFAFLLTIILFLLFHSTGFCQQSPLIQKGMEEYKDESYDEAIVTLTKARNEDPSSSIAAFFLGMSYKQTLDYEKALVNLRDAVTLTPRIKEALVEVIDVAMQLGKIDGMQTLDQALSDLVKKRLVPLEEVLIKSSNPDKLA